MIEMEDHTNDISEGRIPFLDYKTYTDRVFFLPSKDGANDVMITGKLDIPESRRATVTQALNQFSNLLNSKTFLINVNTQQHTHTPQLSSIYVHIQTSTCSFKACFSPVIARKVSKWLLEDNCWGFHSGNHTHKYALVSEPYRRYANIPFNYSQWH